MNDRFLVRIEPLRALARSNEVVNGLRARLTEVEVPREELRDVVARAVERFGCSGDAQVELAPATAEETGVRHLLDEYMVEGELGLVVVRNAIEELSLKELVQDLRLFAGDGLDRDEQRHAKATPDDRGGLENGGGALRQKVDPRCERALERRRDGRFVPRLRHPPGAVVARERACLLQRLDDLLDEERVPARLVEQGACELGG